MTNVNNLIDKTWDRQKFIDRQRRRKKYRFFIRIKNRIILYWLDLKDIFNCSQRNADKISCEFKNRIMLEKIEKIQELLNVPNVDASTETAIANMKILNLLVDLRAEAEQLILSGVVDTLPNIKSKEFCDWMTDNGYTDEQYGIMQKGNKRYCINNLFKHYCNLLEFGN